MRVLVTGGGTGGHLYPALAIMEALEERMPCEFLFVGTKNGIEAKVIPMHRYPFQTIWISGLHRRKVAVNLLFPFKLLVALIQSMAIVSRFAPEAVIGTGGYVSWPVLTAAVILKKKTIIQEQNMYPGLVTRLLAPKVDGVHLSYELSKRFFKKQSNLQISGNPTRKSLEKGNPKEAYAHFQLRPDRQTLLIFGGSQGARGINLAVLSVLDTLMTKRNLQILWATGSRWLTDIKDRIAPWKDRIRARAFIHEMQLAYAISDLVVCRSGATTIAEVARMGLPALFIPYPAAAAGHQEKNARMFHELGAAEMVLESELDSKRFGNFLIQLLKDERHRKKMKLRMLENAEPLAAEIIAKDVLKRVEA